MTSRLLAVFVLLFTTPSCVPIAAGYIAYSASNAETDRKLALVEARSSERTLRAASLLSVKSYIHRGTCTTARTAVEARCAKDGRTTDVFRAAHDTADGRPVCLVEYSCKEIREDDELPTGDDEEQSSAQVRPRREPFRPQ